MKVLASTNLVNFSSAPTFNLSLGEIQTITLFGNVTNSAITYLVANAQITFVIKQDSIGHHSFVWPKNIFGGMDLSQTKANSVSVQTFLSLDGINMHASGIGVTS